MKIFKYILFSIPFLLASYPLMDNNEGLYAQIPIEMLERGDFIIPFLNGVPYIEKPPLLYWLIAICYKIFGISEFSARIPVIFSGVGILLSTGHFIKKHTKSDLFLYMIATCIPFIYISHIVFFDVLLTFLFINSLFFFYNWCESKNNKQLIISYSLLALAALTKGLMVIIFAGIIIVIFLILQKESYKTWINLFNPIAILSFLIIFSPWHIFASIKHDGFAHFYFINEHLLRFLDLRQPKDYYNGPIYYYVPRLLLFLLPWTFGIFSIFKKFNTLDKFLIIKITTIFVFFSISKAKANYYIIMIIPSLIALISMKLNDFKYKKTVLLSGPIISIIVYCGAFILDDFYLKIMAVIGILGLIFSIYQFKKGDLTPISYVLFGPVLMFFVLNFHAKNYQEYFTSKHFIDFVDKKDQDKIYMYKVFENLSTVPFYLKRQVKIIDSISSDLWYGEKTHKNNFISFKNFQSEDKYLLTTPIYKKRLLKKGFKVIKETKKGVMLYHP